MLLEREAKFMEQARAKHGDKYDYSLVVYVNNRTPVSIKCRLCDITFEQRPSNHLTHPDGGCKSCQKSNTSKRRRMSFSEFVAHANRVHGKTYSYDEESFRTSDPHFMLAKCLRCERSFTQRISTHLSRGHGCPWCAGRASYDHDEFVRRAREVHGEAYEYFEQYVNSRTKVRVLCLACDLEWLVHPHNHIDKRSGCPRCYRKRYVSRSETEWLDTLEVPQIERSKWVKASSGKSYLVDALHDGVIYEFYGSYYHGDPRVVKHDKVCLQAKKTFGELYRRTVERQSELERTHEVRYVWEHDWKRGMLLSVSHP